MILLLTTGYFVLKRGKIVDYASNSILDAATCFPFSRPNRLGKNRDCRSGESHIPGTRSLTRGTKKCGRLALRIVFANRGFFLS